MHSLLAIGLSNAVAASLLALAAGAVGYGGRRPAVAHGLWLLVLLKLLTPPLWNIPVSWPTGAGPATVPPAAAFEAPLEPIPQEQEGPPAASLFTDEPTPLPASPEEPPASPPPSSADAPLMRIDALMKEVEALRRELRTPRLGREGPGEVQIEIDGFKKRFEAPVQPPLPGLGDVLYFFRGAPASKP
jgi:hypothetical protein